MIQTKLKQEKVILMDCETKWTHKLCDMSMSLPEGPDWVLHGSRKSFRQRWRQLVGSWSSPWKFSTTWCCTDVCLKNSDKDWIDVEMSSK